jgi:hypothetical protein
MDTPDRGALTLTRLIGVLFVVASILELGLYWAKCSMPAHREPVQVFPVLVRLTPAVAGLIILIRARPIAQWISNILDL